MKRTMTSNLNPKTRIITNKAGIRRKTSMWVILKICYPGEDIHKKNVFIFSGQTTKRWGGREGVKPPEPLSKKKTTFIFYESKID